MSNAFDKASLVMLPHAYEEGKLYSLKPTDRSGDFTFSRGTDTATRVNEQGYIEILTDLNSPRLDYLNSSCPSLLLEPQRTNIAKNDLGFNGFGGCTIANEVVTNPFGDTTDVFSATFTSTGGFRLNDSPSLISGTEYCMGHFMKFNNSAITISASGASGAVLSASGAFSFDSSGNPSKIGDVYFIEYPNGWYYVYALTNAIANGGTRVNWNESSGSILICKSQYEAGSYPTSYIPTYGSSQTRAQEVSPYLYNLQSKGIYEGGEYSFYIDTRNDIITDADDDNSRVIVMETSSGNDIFTFRKEGIGFRTFYNLNGQWLGNEAAKGKYCYVASSSSIKTYVNGELHNTYNYTISPFGLDRLIFQYGHSDRTIFRLGGFVFINQALSETEAKALTTL